MKIFLAWKFRKSAVSWTSFHWDPFKTIELIGTLFKRVSHQRAIDMKGKTVSSVWYKHRPLHTYMNINENFEDYHRRPTFPGLLALCFVTKLVVTQGTTRYQFKDMDIFFWYPLVYCGLSGLDTTAFQSQAFFQNAKKCWKLTVFTQHWISTFW